MWVAWVGSCLAAYQTWSPVALLDKMWDSVAMAAMVLSQCELIVKILMKYGWDLLKVTWISKN